MNTKTTGRVLAAAVLAGGVVLVGCAPVEQTVPDTGGVTPHEVAPEDFPGSGGSEPAKAPAGLLDCDPQGFGPLSGCAHGTVTPNAADAIADVPAEDPTLVVTRKFHRDGEYPAWCVEARVPHDEHDRFRRDCVLDTDRTAEDQDWLDHQVVGRLIWYGAS